MADAKHNLVAGLQVLKKKVTEPKDDYAKKEVRHASSTLLGPLLLLFACCRS